jgi:hypothetical protein
MLGILTPTGTKTVVFLNGRMVDHTTKKDKFFTREEVVYDPLGILNDYPLVRAFAQPVFEREMGHSFRCSFSADYGFRFRSGQGHVGICFVDYRKVVTR